MTEYRFTFNYTDTYSLASDSLVVDEPRNFSDGFTSELKRDMDYHGVFFYLSSNDITLSFAGSGRTILKEQFEAFGFDANVELTIERRASSLDSFTTVYTGRAEFETIEFDNDFGTISFYEDNALIRINNNKDLPVSTSENEDLNGDAVTPLTPTDITLKGRAITERTGTDFEDGNGTVFTTNQSGLTISDNVLIPTINQVFYGGYERLQSITSGGDSSLIGALVLKANEFFTDVTFKFTISYTITVTEAANVSGSFELGYRVYDVDSSGGTTVTNNILVTLDKTSSTPVTYGTTVTINTPAEDTTRYLAFIYQDSMSFATGTAEFEIDINTIEFSIAAVASRSSSTTGSNTIFDAVNHNLNVIANTPNLLASNILDSGGALAGLYETNGYMIRKADGFPIISSFTDRIKSLKSIFNIGYGLEKDYAGDDVIRVEQMEYFYVDEELISFSEVEADTYRESINPDFIFNKVKLGFETDSQDEEVAGTTEDVHTKLTALSPVQDLQQAYEWYSVHAASDILIEIIRRKQFADDNTEKTDYDETLFLLDCVGTTLAYPADMEISTVNIENGDTGSNYRLNLRNAIFNHGDMINGVALGKDAEALYKVKDYKNAIDQSKKIGYTGGSYANIGDETEYSSILTLPSLDGSVTVVSVGSVLFRPFLITFRVSLSDTQLNLIIDAHRNQAASANYGYISVTNPLGEVKTGWLLSMKYTEVDKIAEITLIERETNIIGGRITDDGSQRITDANENRVV